MPVAGVKLSTYIDNISKKEETECTEFENQIESSETSSNHTPLSWILSPESVYRKPKLTLFSLFSSECL